MAQANEEMQKEIEKYFNKIIERNFLKNFRENFCIYEWLCYEHSQKKQRIYDIKKKKNRMVYSGKMKKAAVDQKDWYGKNYDM
ncbi:hypothetical protein [Faecalicoccus sp. LCP19S3_E2]|uniref:hypothetical protein n=2 Tax=Faecalicoccus TaxID=1573536 RepID=UPI003F903174